MKDETCDVLIKSFVGLKAIKSKNLYFYNRSKMNVKEKTRS